MASSLSECHRSIKINTGNNKTTTTTMMNKFKQWRNKVNWLQILIYVLITLYIVMCNISIIKLYGYKLCK